jgi:hypothetical protein
VCLKQASWYCCMLTTIHNALKSVLLRARRNMCLCGCVCACACVCINKRERGCTCVCFGALCVCVFLIVLEPVSAKSNLNCEKSVSLLLKLVSQQRVCVCSGGRRGVV